MGTKLTGDQERAIGRRLNELMRQVFTQEEYKFNPNMLIDFLQRAIEGEWNLPCSWIKKPNGNVIFILPPTVGWRAEGWILYLEDNLGFFLNNDVKVLLKKHLVPTEGKVYQIEIQRVGPTYIKMEEAFAQAHNVGLGDLTIEAVCLIRANFTDSEIENMGFSSIFAMHDPIDGYLLEIERSGTGVRGGLTGLFTPKGTVFGRNRGLAFSIT